LRRLENTLKENSDNTDAQNQIEEVRRKLVYIKFYPHGEKYISILKDDTLTPDATRLREEFWQKAINHFERYKRKLLEAGQEPKAADVYDGLQQDKFFEMTMDHEGLEDEEDRPVKRAEVDKKGNVIKRR